jgi:hypothetical protein
MTAVPPFRALTHDDASRVGLVGAVGRRFGSLSRRSRKARTTTRLMTMSAAVLCRCRFGPLPVGGNAARPIGTCAGNQTRRQTGGERNVKKQPKAVTALSK